MSVSKLYEGMFLFDSNLAARDWPGLENHVQDLFDKNGAKLVYSERWPDRKLSYEIKGCKKGTYYLTYFQAPPTAIAAIKRETELSERILRLLVIYDEMLGEECEKRIRREVTGSPEEIEQARERSSHEPAAQGRTTPAGPTEAGATATPPAASEAAPDEKPAASGLGETAQGTTRTGGEPNRQEESAGPPV